MSSQDGPRTPRNDEPGGRDYEEKLAELRKKYLPFLNETIAKLEANNSNEDQVAKLRDKIAKLRNLQNVLTSSRQLFKKVGTLERCEEFLKKLGEKVQNLSDNPASGKIIKTEPIEVTESPASPPQPDLNPPKSTPKIIPVERCATVERDFSRVDEGTTLEASRNRLKGLMLKNEFKRPTAVEEPSPKIPGLDLAYSNQEPSSIYSCSSVGSSSMSQSGTEARNQSYNPPWQASREEWSRLDSMPPNKADSTSVWPSHRGDRDDRIQDRDVNRDPRSFKRDIDERLIPGTELRTQVQSSSNHPTPVPPPLMNQVNPQGPSYLPRHMPTHNAGFMQGGSTFAAQEFHRSTDSFRMEGGVSHHVMSQTFTSSSISGSQPMAGNPPPGLHERMSGHPHYPNQLRDKYDRSSIPALLANPATIPPSPPLLPTPALLPKPALLPNPPLPPAPSFLAKPKTFSGAVPVVEERRSIPSAHTSSQNHAGSQGDGLKPSARERIMQKMDEVEKLGVSQGGALRKLKSDIMERGKKKSGDKDLPGSEEPVQPRNVDPRLEKERRRSSLEDDAQKMKLASRHSEGTSGPAHSSTSHNISNISARQDPFGGSVQTSVQWNQSHITPPLGRPAYQGHHGVINTVQWQTTCTVKQTTAHDLGMRYQPKSRQGRLPHTSHSALGNALKLNEDKHSGLREVESQRKDNDVSQPPGRRQSDPRLSDPRLSDPRLPDPRLSDPRLSDPRLSSLKPSEEKKSVDSRSSDLCLKKKDKEKEDSDISSPLNKLYSDKRSKTGQGYGTQCYRIPKRPKEPSPPKDSSQIPKQTLTDPHCSANRDPRLSKATPKESSPDPPKETDATQRVNVPAQEIINTSEDVALVAPVSGEETVKDKSNQKRSGSCSPSREKLEEQKDSKDGSQTSKSKVAPDHRSPSPLQSREGSPIDSRGRSRSTSRGRSSSKAKSVRNSSRSQSRRGRSRSNSRSRSRSASKSRFRQRSSSRSRTKSTRRSTSRGRSTSRARSRGRSTSRGRSRRRSTSRGRSRGRSTSRARSRGRSTSRGRSRRRSSSRTRVRERSTSRGRSRGRSSSRTRRRSVSRGRSRGRSISRTRGKSRQRGTSRSRGRSSSRSKNRNKSRDRSLSRSRTRSTYSSSSFKSRNRRSSSRSPSRSRRSPSYARERLSGRYRDKSRARSHSSDSDRYATLDRWKRKESKSPDRGSTSRSRRRSASMDSDRSRSRSRVSSIGRDQFKKQPESKRRGRSRESVKDAKKSTASSRSSSGSGRSSPLFPKERSISASPSREMDFDTLFKKGNSEVYSLQSSEGIKGSIKKSGDSLSQKDTDVSSSVNVGFDESKSVSSGDVVIGVPTSTSENIQEAVCKSDVGSSSEVSAGNNISTPQSSKQDSVLTSASGNLIVGLIKSLASQDIFKNTSLIELAELAASQLPEDKRNKVLEIFKEQDGSSSSKANEDRGQTVSAVTSEPNTSTAESSDMTTATFDTPGISSKEPKPPIDVPNVTPKGKGSKKKKKKVTSQSKLIPDGSCTGNIAKEISPDSLEKQRKKRGKNELEKLHEDIREMFICKEVITATGQRSCRMRKENQETVPPPKHRPGPADDKAKASRSKQDESMDFSDNSFSKGQTLNISDCKVEEGIDCEVRDSSGSDDEMPAQKWRKTSGDPSDTSSRRKNLLSFLESESESDSMLVDDEIQEMDCPVPLVVLEKTSRRNVARRGRKIGNMSRDQMKTKEEVYTPSYDGDHDDENEDLREDKDMSQIDTSNIIQVESGKTKLTRNQLKLLKMPEPKQKVNLRNRRSRNPVKDISECESDASKASEPLIPKEDFSEFDSTPSPVKKKRRIKIKKNTNIKKVKMEQKTFLKQESEWNETEGLLPSQESFDTVSLVDVDGDVSMDSNILSTQDKHNERLLTSTSTDLEHDLPLSLRRQSLQEVENCESEPISSKPGLHADLHYNLDLSNKKTSCKLCPFLGKNIVNHYVTGHPAEEVLISRLPKALADFTKKESRKYVGGLKTLTAQYSIKKKSSRLQCLICNAAFNTALQLYEHVSLHTGEYRYSCSLCDYKAAQKLSMKCHKSSAHNNDSSDKELCNVYSPVGCKRSMKVLFAYICSECNYFQLSESKVSRHLEMYHPQKKMAQVIRISISNELIPPTLVSTKEEAAPVLDMADNCLPLNLPESSMDESIRKAIENVIQQMSVDSEEETACPGSATQSRKPTLAPDVSVFVGSEQPAENDDKLHEERKKILDEASTKVRNRREIRCSVSEKLALKLQSEQLNSSSAGDEVACGPHQALASDENLSQHLSSDSWPDSGKDNVKMTSSRSSLKSCDASEKRLTRSTSRTTIVASDSECQPILSDVPDEVKQPLPACILSHTLQRMQETIRCPVSSPSATSSNSSTLPPSSSTDIFSYSEFVLKNGQVTVGLVEAKAFDDTLKSSFVCRSLNCSFNTKQLPTFERHIGEHSRKPGPAPCSLCGEGENILRDMQSSLNHLLKYHLTEASTKEIPDVKSNSSDLMSHQKPLLIRPRKLPGDTLSEPDSRSISQDSEEIELPSLVIASVVSLSKDHTPDGVPLGSESQDPLALLSQSSVKVATKFRKDQISMQEMMRFEKICHLFKCVGQHCSFSTSLKDGFSAHYHKHLLKELQQSPNAASQSFQWQKCVYCGESKDSGEDLADHILSQHDVLKHQCSGCFYRALSSGSVAFHQKKAHNSNVMVFQCSKPLNLKAHQSKSMQSHLNRIQIYRCVQGSGYGECGFSSVSAEDFSSHQHSVHFSDKNFYCNECGLGLDSPSKLLEHYSTSHVFRLYHCLHCPKAAETCDEICWHMCLDHPDQEMLVASRIRPTNSSNAGIISLPYGKVINLIDLGDAASSITVVKDQETDLNNDPLFFDEESALQCLTYDINAKSSWAHQTLPAASSIRSLPGNKDMDTTIQRSSSGKSKQLLQSSNASLEKVGNDAELNVGNERNTDPDSKDENLIGLSGLSLYLCGYSGCSFKAEKSPVLKEHLSNCKFSLDAGNLSCLHCHKEFRHPITLMEHLPKHGVPRYLCGFCHDFQTTHPKIVTRHVKHKHKTSAVEMVLMDPEQSDPDTAMFVVRPKENVSKRGKGKLSSLSNKSNYGPDERELLPKCAVFTRDVTCSVCQYSTKVRSNMMRHLEQHAHGCEPSSVPILNPVPCLERKEKMFDTMTNHAISSTVPIRRDSNTFKVTDEPRFVPENQRYVCCAPACNQISGDESMLRHHIRVLHPEIVVYKCPHCPDSDSDGGKQAIMLEKLGSHLKMHDSRLYSCLCCTYYHYQRYFVERHTGEKHPEQKFIKIVREPQPDGVVDSENVVDTESEIMCTEGSYECGLCEAKGMSKADADRHAVTVHHIHAPYKCGICNFKSKSRASFGPHFSRNHPDDKENVIEVVIKSKLEKPNEETSQIPPELPTPPIECPPLVFDSSPLWRRDSSRIRHVRGILFEENGLKPRELELTPLSNAEVPTFARSKRSLSSPSYEDISSSKREKRENPCLTCALCLMKFPVMQVASYREHLLSHLSSGICRYKCRSCLKTFSTTDEATAHVRESHNRISTTADVIDTYSEEYINMDITRQTLNMGLPTEAPVTKPSFSGNVPSSSGFDLFNISLKTSESSSKKIPLVSLLNTPPGGSKRSSPRNSGSSSTNTAASSPAKTPRSELAIGVSPKGIRPLNRRSVLKPGPSKQSSFESPMSSTSTDSQLISSPDKSPSKESKCQVEKSWNELEGDIEVDERALEEDIEEVEEDDCLTPENTIKELSLEISGGKQNLTQSSPSAAPTGEPCKYKISHGCNYVSKSELEADFHDKRHWEVQPWKCGHCNYQGVKESSIKLHNSKTHGGLPPRVEANNLPAVPKILSLSRSRIRPSFSLLGGITSSARDAPPKEKFPEALKPAEFVYAEELFKDLHVLRCGYCRLRETSLGRLFMHWQGSHRDNKTLNETTPDGRQVVPFKFREVKWDSPEQVNIAFRCGLCSKMGTIKRLLEHYPSCHPGEKLKISELVHDRLQCSLCVRQFSTKTALRLHFSTSHPGETFGSVKIKTQSISSDTLDCSMGCLYCLEPVKTTQDMTDHHLNFHSHLDAKYMAMDLDTSDPEQQPSTEKTSAEYSFVATDSAGQSAVSKTPPSRPSVITCVRRDSEEQPSTMAVVSEDPCQVSQPVVKRAVAKKSTSKVRAVARKSTGGRCTAKQNPSPLSSSLSSSDDECSVSSEDSVDVSKIICPMMIGGTRMKVNLATLSQHSNIYPTIPVKRLDS